MSRKAGYGNGRLSIQQVSGGRKDAGLQCGASLAYGKTDSLSRHAWKGIRLGRGHFPLPPWEGIGGSEDGMGGEVCIDDSQRLGFTKGSVIVCGCFISTVH